MPTTAAAAAAGRGRRKSWWGELKPIVSKKHNLNYLFYSYGHKKPIISRLYYNAQEHKTDEEKIKKLTLAAQHVYREHRYFENTVSKPPVDLFPGWNIPPAVSGEHFITSMIQVAEKHITISDEDRQHFYTSMLAPYQRQQKCHI